MIRRNPDRRPDRFLGPYGRGFGILWTKMSHRLRTYFIIGLGLLACWVVLVPGYVWIVDEPHSVAAALRWGAATLFDLVGLHDWRWTVDTNNGEQRWRSNTIRFDDWHLAQVDVITISLRTGLLVATGICLVLGPVALVCLAKIDQDVSAKRIVRGRRLVSDKKVAKDLRKKKIASELQIGNVPLIKHAEAYNTLLLGAQGTGKTSALEALFEGITKRGEPAVVYDYGPGLLQRFYNADRGDIILNPLDERSVSWSPWSEIKKAADCTAIAEAFIPKGTERDPFWGNAGRLLYAEVLDRLRNDPDRSVKKLLHILLRMSQAEVRDILKGTNAAKLFDEGAERTGKSVEIHNSVYIKALGLLPANAGQASCFSIHDYVQALDQPAPEGGRPWLWLTADPKSSTTLKPLLSCWVNAVASALVSLPERLDRRLWLGLDELSTLHELPALAPFMQNARKRGGSAVITLQTPSQLYSSYEKPAADTILNGCQTQAIFRVTDPEGSEWASRSIGEAEIEEMRESARLNSAGGRGHEVNLSIEKRISRVVLPGEIAMLENLHCYVKLPEAWPVSKTVVKPRAPLNSGDPAPGFVERIDFSDTAGEVLTEMSVIPAAEPGTSTPPSASVKSAANPKAVGSKKQAPKPTSPKPNRKKNGAGTSDVTQLSLVPILDKNKGGSTSADSSKTNPASSDDWS